MWSVAQVGVTDWAFNGPQQVRGQSLSTRTKQASYPGRSDPGAKGLQRGWTCTAVQSLSGCGEAGTPMPQKEGACERPASVCLHITMLPGLLPASVSPGTDYAWFWVEVLTRCSSPQFCDPSAAFPAVKF